ncbi:MAG TPA: hypothetical protein ENJ89_02295 [Caldithrix abyssi]|uniref:MotA/TolQ/ExbB proton channel domain-containing protein n=1 Tax=Caldithrix abyssi TaxID=187145 RepID=A0A7V5PMU8_CALAY|nr:hypothetical protein [Caldithrix abyssi]
MKTFKLKNVLLIFLLLTGALLAQPSAPGEARPLSGDVVKIYFFLIVLATVINRIVEYVKSLLEWIWPKIGLLRKLGDAIWDRVKDYLDHLQIVYQETVAREQIMKFLVALSVHTLGIAVGIYLCVTFGLGVVDKLGIQHINPTLNAVISGVAAGLGIDAVHSIFRLAEEKRKFRKWFGELSEGKQDS